jgi:hypothetical protein
VAIVTGIFEVAAAIHLLKQITGEWLLILCGAASVLLGLLIVCLARARWRWWIEAYAIVFGILFIVL